MCKALLIALFCDLTSLGNVCINGMPGCRRSIQLNAAFMTLSSAVTRTEKITLLKIFKERRKRLIQHAHIICIFLFCHRSQVYRVIKKKKTFKKTFLITFIKGGISCLNSKQLIIVVLKVGSRNHQGALRGH